MDLKARRRFVVAGLASVFLNVVLTLIVAIAGTHREHERWFVKLATFMGMPGGFIAESLSWHGHDIVPVIVFLFGSWLFYAALLWLVLAVWDWRRTLSSG